MSKERIMSGMRPTGKLHLGHYLGVLKNWVALQNEYDCFYAIADWHALTTKFDDTQSLKDNVRNVVMDWIASGIDPEISTVYLQSLVPETAELHIYLSMITPQNWVERDPTLKDMIKIVRGTEGTDEKPSNFCSYGLMGYPVLMSADILTFNAHCVPVGIDQVAHIEITRDIVRRFNHIYKSDYLNEPGVKLTQVPLLKGIDGQKMGKSFQNDIKISDSPELTAKKIMQGITDRSRIRKDDPGHPEECEVIYDYYKIFADENLLKQVDDECRNAKRGCADCKRQLASLINEHFAPIRAKRLELEQNPKIIDEIIIEGSKKARVSASEVLNNVKNIVKMYVG
ncbi:MAG: tryptophan--tRNA ligase [Candidatus Gastranaerophilales bacterium]|nr:tryptophan--tRNA ligase [Candidatus Gastranaerophilales bacterium]